MQEEPAQQMEDATRAKFQCSTPRPGPSNYDSISPITSHTIRLVQEQICTAIRPVQDLQDQEAAHSIAPKVTYLCRA
ncbi:hypothetical protein B7P43_G17463 [Cryptotermes secundus]|uniref:Uncharacterized protein n=1 Tax=Cryptotermes secundus TaxID=105785 RepID=A0A2J7Q3U6_9NEOP|nr:hypothetical protein B7P43_G17463 [Cryptotermes secundus]